MNDNYSSMILPILLLAIAQGWTPLGPEYPIADNGAYWCRPALSPPGVRAYAWTKGTDTWFRVQGGMPQRVNQTTKLQQDEPEIAWGRGGWLVVWSDRSSLHATYMMSMGRRYDMGSAAQGGEFALLPYASGSTCFLPRVCARAGGGWAVTATATWGEDQAWRTISPFGVGGPEHLAHPPNGAVQDHGDIAEAEPGTLYVVWEDAAFNARDIRCAALDAASGAILGGPYAVNLTKPEAQRWPMLDATPDGQGAAVWWDQGHIRARRLAPGAIPVGPEITLGGGSDPHVALDGQGGYFAVWHDKGAATIWMAHVGGDDKLISLLPANVQALGPPPSQSQPARRNPSIVRSGATMLVGWNAAGPNGETCWVRGWSR